MHRTQVYLTDVQRRQLARRATDEGISQAEVVRRILDRELGILRGTDDRVAVVEATAGVLADHPDWPQWLADVRGAGSSAPSRPVKIFDSTVLISHLRGTPAATQLLREAVAGGMASCSVLSRVEIEGGMRSGERSAVARLFSVLDLEPVTDLIAGRAAEFLRAHRGSDPGIDVVDYVIAATADVLGAELLTQNVKHFPMFKGLKHAF
jgi:predicted nucleic acid-binding protein